jgi:DNA-binding CsgD family transcriptional regulator
MVLLSLRRIRTLTGVVRTSGRLLSPASAVLLGRDEELAAVRRTVGEARAGRSGVLVLEGEPGIGKTSLLRRAIAEAEDVRVLRAQGVESEAELAHAGLHELLRPILALVDQLPAPQAEALRGALLLAPVATVDRFAIYVAVVSLLAAAADQRPVLVVVDDGHWIDTASAEALTFAARRLDADGIAMLIALRRNGRSPFAAAPLPRLALRGLSREHAAALLAQAASCAVDRRVSERLHDTTGGNPLALLELAERLSKSELAGRAPLREALSPGGAIEETVARRVGALSEEARTALLVAAASDARRMDTILCAAEARGVTAAAFAEAEAAELVSVDGSTLRFQHPLLRSSVYASAPPGLRREAHLALAGCLGDDRPEERAWHLAAAALAPDESIAAALEEAAHRFSRRSGYSEAARALERAASLTPSDDVRARRLLAAAEAAWSSGSAAWAGELLAEALRLAHDPLLSADIEFRQATIEAWAGSTRGARDRYLAQAERLAPRDPDRAAAALAYAAALWAVAGDLGAAGSVAERAAELAASATVSPRTERIVAETLGTVLIMQGRATEGTRLVGRAAAWFEGEEQRGGSHYAALSLTWVEEYELARRLVEELVTTSRRHGDLRALAAGLEVLAELEYRVGDWQRAYAAASESTRLADETGQPVQHAYSAAVLAIVEAAQGRESAREHAQLALDLGQQRGLAMMTEYAGYALGLLELGLGRFDQAIDQLERAAVFARASGRGEPGVLQWGPDLVEAYVRAGRREQAREALGELEQLALETDRRWALAAVARCRALLAQDEEAETAFTEAALRHEVTPAPFERARNDLCYGEWLRRARRRRDAREALRRALAAFERLGAVPWAEAARRELDATGETIPRRDLGADEVLTAQELQVALVVAKGATNKEAATALFLSPKTIESHLSSAYRKLGVRSRTELARRLTAAP